jgi:hypothetical protein
VICSGIRQISHTEEFWRIPLLQKLDVMPEFSTFWDPPDWVQKGRAGIETVWLEVDSLYRPLILGWLRQIDIQLADQEVA